MVDRRVRALGEYDESADDGFQLLQDLEQAGVLARGRGSVCTPQWPGWEKGCVDRDLLGRRSVESSAPTHVLPAGDRWVAVSVGDAGEVRRSTHGWSRPGRGAVWW